MKKKILTFEEFFKSQINEDILTGMTLNQEVEENYPLREDGSIDYYNIKDPKTGTRYNIPFLSTEDEQYVQKYINYMKTLVEDKEQFNDLMEWK